MLRLEEVVYFPSNMASPFGRIGFEACSTIFASLALSLSLSFSLLVRIRFSLISVSTLLLCFKISCYLAGLLFRPPSLCPSVRGQHGRRRNDQRPPFGRSVPGFFKFRPVRPVDWSVKTCEEEDGRDPGPARTINANAS